VADFNPFSVDSQLAGIIETLRQQNRASEAMHSENKKVQAAILAEAKITNCRVTALEGRWKYVTGIAAGVSFCAGLLWEFSRNYF
jgi:hypothetical protein